MGIRRIKKISKQTRAARRNNSLKGNTAQMELKQLKTEFKLFRLETMAKIKELEERL